MTKRISRIAMVITLVVLSVGAPRVAQAQGWLTLRTDDSTIKRSAPTSTLVVPVVVDLLQTGGGSIDRISSAIAWNPAFVTLDSVVRGSFGPLSNQKPINTAGTLTFDASSLLPHAEPTPILLATLYYTTGQTTGGTRLSVTPTDASLAGTHLTSGELVGWTQDICVALPGVWGDVDASGVANVMDAQQIARSVVDAPVIDTTRIANNGDVDGDGEVTILDAQLIARFDVGASAPARIGTPRSVPPTVHALTMNQSSLTLPVDTTTSLIATPVDSAGFTIVGCQTSTWSSDNAPAVRVNATGQITAVSAGTAKIVAKSGSAADTSTVTVVP